MHYAVVMGIQLFFSISVALIPIIASSYLAISSYVPNNTTAAVHVIQYKESDGVTFFKISGSLHAWR